jgi:hypothetical protein
MLAPVAADYVAVLRPAIEQNKIKTMAKDVFFVDSMRFLITISQRIKFVTVQHVPLRTAKSPSKHFK